MFSLTIMIQDYLKVFQWVIHKIQTGNLLVHLKESLTSILIEAEEE